MIIITETEKKKDSKEIVNDIDSYLSKIYDPNLRNLLRKCYQCGTCSGVCQLSKVQKFTPSRIIEMILEGFENRVIESGVLWDCIMCNSCLQNCPEDVNFADLVRMAKYKMRNIEDQNPEEYIAHKGIYTTLSEIMSESNLQPERNLDWVPKECKITESGKIMYYVGCLPFFKFEFENIGSIATSTLKLICQIEKEPIVVLKEESCCGHDLYWGQGKFEPFIELAKKNLKMFENAGISTIVTACAECYRTLKVDYPTLFEDFDKKFEVQHIIEYIYNSWKENKIEFKNPEQTSEPIQFTFHDPCRLSRFLPKSNNIIHKVREIFNHLEKIGYKFNEMEHSKENSLCCGVSSWMNCNERSKALRYKRLSEAKAAGTKVVTSCPKCIMHLSCLKDDFEEFGSMEILDFSEFLVNLVNVIDDNVKKEEEQ